MKALVHSIYTNPKYAKVFHLGKLITVTGGAQAIVQGAGFVSGILVIRLLPTQEYAWYTLANTMLGTMTLLSDGGISTGVMAQGSRVWQDKEKLGAVLVTGFDLRKKFAVASLIVALPVLIYLLLRHEASWLTTLLITASLIPAFFAALSDSLLEIIPKLHQDLNSLQKNQIVVSLGRLLLSTATLFLFPFTFVAVLAAGIPRVYGNIELNKIANVFANNNQKPDPYVRKAMIKIIKHMLPGAIYASVSSQIMIWLISILGTTVAVADVGALGRLAMLLNVFTVIFSTIVVPRFARLPTNYKYLFTKFLQIQLGVLLFCLTIIGIISLFPSQALSILGNAYSSLNSVIVLSMIGNCVNLMVGVAISLYTCKGWTIGPFVFIPISIGTIICGALLINLSTLEGVLKLNLFIGIVQFLVHNSFCFLKMYLQPIFIRNRKDEIS